MHSAALFPQKCFFFADLLNETVPIARQLNVFLSLACFHGNQELINPLHTPYLQSKYSMCWLVWGWHCDFSILLLFMLHDPPCSVLWMFRYYFTLLRNVVYTTQSSLMKYNWSNCTRIEKDTSAEHSVCAQTAVWMLHWHRKKNQGRVLVQTNEAFTLC